MQFVADNLPLIIGLVIVLAGGLPFAIVWARRISADVQRGDWAALAGDFAEMTEEIASGRLSPDEAKAWMEERTRGTTKGTLLNGTLIAMGEYKKSSQLQPPAPGAGLAEEAGEKGDQA